VDKNELIKYFPVEYFQNVELLYRLVDKKNKKMKKSLPKRNKTAEVIDKISEDN